MNRFILAITIFNLVAWIGYVTFKETTADKIAYVDANYLLNNYKGMAQAREEYKKKTTVWQANIDTLASEVARQISEYQKSISKSTAKERQLAQELIQTKQQQLDEYRNALNIKAQQEEEQMTRTVLVSVNSFIKEYGQRNGYTLILSATEYGNIAYASDWLNITDDILSGLNK